jgi:hypothetical protein
MDNMIRLKLTVAHAKCSNCGFERKLYFMSDYAYGERVVSTKDGQLCAYANLLDEQNISELFNLTKIVFSEINIIISDSKLKRIVSNIYGILCDKINGEIIDNTPNWKCSNCNIGKMIEDKVFGENLMEIEVPIVTHVSWNSLNESEKKQVIIEELKQQAYI